MTARQTAADTLERILAGTSPWVAVGDFIDGWHRSRPEERADLIADEPRRPQLAEHRRWAAFIAATADSLSRSGEDRVEVAEWVRSRRYVLDEPWFLLPGESLRLHQLVDTPAPFSVRNIFGGDRIIHRV